MKIIHYSTVFKTLDVFVKQHNSRTPKLSNHLRQSIVATAREIIKIYSISLLKANKIQPLDLDNIPPLETNSAQLATMSNVCPRTIRRHIRRLLDANVLTEKVYKGRKTNYELRFNPNILLINGVQAVKKHENSNKSQKSKSTDNQFFKNNIRTSCPQSNSSNTSYINNLIIGVDNKLKTEHKESLLPLTCTSRTRHVTGNSFTGYTEKKKHVKKFENFNRLQGKLGAKNIITGEDAEREKQQKRAENQAEIEISKPDQARAASLNTHVNSLWKLAKNTLYKDVFLTDNQEKRAKELLKLWYAPVKERHFSKVHKVYVDRIELVRKYLEKDKKNRFVQLPNRYFDPNNPSGFTGTKKWYENQVRSKQKTRLKLILHAQIRCFLNNEKKNTTDQKPRLALFRQCEARLSKLNQPELLHQFYGSILNRSTFNFLKINA